MNLRPRTWLVATLLAAAVPSQAKTPQDALARAQLLETKEHDLAAAHQAYRALLDDTAAAGVHGTAALRLGALLWRLDQKDAAKPLLERAVAAGGDAGKEATAILQGQGEHAKLAQERLTKARALVGLYAQLRGSTKDFTEGNEVYVRAQTVLTELRPLGAQAAEAIAEFLEVGLRTGRIAKYPGDDPVRPRMMCLLWEIGTQPAAIALRRWSEPEDLNVRLGAAEGCKATKVATDLEPVLLAYVRDPDPSGEVWRLVVNAVVNLPHERHVELLAAADAPTRAAGLHALATTWNELSREQRELFVERHAAAVRRATRDADTRVVNQAWRVIHELGGGPTSATLVFFAETDRYPGDVGKIDMPHRVDANDGWLHAIADAARRADLPARPVLQALLHCASHTWTRAAVDDVITLLDLGYGPRGGSDWALPALRFADAAQLSRLIALLPRAGSQKWVHELRNRTLPQDAFPALRDVLEQAFAGTAMPWKQFFESSARVVRGRNVGVATTDKDTLELLACAASTRHPEVASWLCDRIDRHPQLAARCAQLLIEMSLDGAGPTAHAALRKLLVWEGTEHNELQPDERSLVFAELARVGDVAAIPLFPRAYELGLARVRASRRPASKAEPSQSSLAAGIGFLGNDDAKPWHGYGDADLVTAWRTLLDSPRLDRILADFTRYLYPSPGAPSPSPSDSVSIEIPLAVLPLVCERLPALWHAGGSHDPRDDVRSRVCNTLNNVTIADVKPGSALRNALTALFRDENTTLAMLLGALPSDVTREFAADGKALLQRAPSGEVLQILEGAGIELRQEDWAAALSADDVEVRVHALRLLPKSMGAPMRAMIESQFGHTYVGVRLTACDAVQRLYGPDSVTSLLPVLQDPEPDVREHARKALDQLRQDAEQRAFWANAGSGIDTSQRGAAAKLLAQAKAGEPKDQRVLALRSLAVLGAAEALPYLIDATKDQDGDVAAAAREAIAAIHTRSGAPVPANK